MNARNSRVLAALDASARRFRGALSTATVTSLYRRARDVGGAAVEGSFLSTAADRLGAITRASWLYRWLTSDPDPDVVVIDLRETIVLGPVLAVLDALVTAGADRWQGARVRSLFERATASLADRPIRIASALALGALLTELIARLAVGTPSAGAIGVRLLATSLALAGTRVTISREQVSDSRTADALVALFEPPPPPDGDDR